ncbi:ankyrin repeat and SOCS box protein 12a [Latimeria chalumnae]|uniref:Ankyrin repeat and SOCS box protein 12 n=1 Tax=Latimeria chalumnae TaxID=7897 RepID=H3B7I9_LATCH|nr:PREDICTED: ankyrin repeat and SOCS box protein 12 [Latimeria chalumnae]XP_005994994.1 PREDICTED: ankyrin repeat and SOCS box protein 12 [Latimeria chalumnae]XP_014343281.1 PREDICTED: ankyrin repeat and SOCS box protein 12 [Latimeria chalumnae]|eukprot:XP_005994993.1 PREDICTED: ankyrin repeat and SOCS box protein 12 [Latimeria chalumnae]
MKMVFVRPVKMSLVDITKIFSMLRPKQDEDNGERQQLNQAVANDNHTLLTELLSQEKYRRFINSRSGWGVPGTPLRLAATKGHLRCLEILLTHGAEVDSLDVKAQTPLFTAVSGGHLDCVQALLAAGANPNGSIYNNSSPLLTAAREGDLDILRELLEHGAEVNVRSKVPDWASNVSGCTGPLYLSAAYGHLECFKLLLFYGAEPNYNCTDERLLVKIKNPRTVLDMCLKHGCGVEYVQLLIDFGANVYLPIISTEKTVQPTEAVRLLLRERVFPKTLMSQTRIAIRKHLQLVNRIRSIDELEIPAILRNYLKHQTLESCEHFMINSLFHTHSTS